MKFPSREMWKASAGNIPPAPVWNWCRWMMRRPLPVGTKGTVEGVDDTGSLLMRWDNGSGLNVVYGEDIVQKIPMVKTVCYGRTKEWYSRAEAEQFFFHAMMNSEGSEQNRYMKIYTELKLGKAFCTDEEE